MSFRNTFITDYLYIASDETRAAEEALTVAFQNWADKLSTTPDARGYGFYSGINRTHGGSISEHEGYMADFLIAARDATPIPFRLTMMLESNAVITYYIEPKETK